MKYNVYTKVKFISGTEYDVVVTGIEASSLAGAEHVILDNFHVDNALADAMAKPTKYFTEAYLDMSEIMSLNEFKVRMMAAQASGKAQMNEALNEENEIEREIEKAKKELAALEQELAEARERTEAIANAFGIKRQYTAAEKIEAAIAAKDALISA